jgi:transposase
MKPYSLDLREKIISTYEAGNTSIRQVAERFQVSKTTVQSLLKRKQATGTLKPAVARGGKASQLVGYEQEIAEMVEMVETYQDYTLAKYCEYWQDKTGVRVSESTMCRFLQKQQLTVLKKHFAALKPQKRTSKRNELLTGRGLVRFCQKI